jgi:signal transduction histidine kinase
MILMVAGKELLISETKDIDQEIAHESENDSNITIYSNDRSVVSTYYEILNILWSRDELFRKSELANTRLKYQEKLQREFVHNFSNGLRNPIQPILGLSEILLEYDKTVHLEYNQIVNVIHACSQ